MERAADAVIPTVALATEVWVVWATVCVYLGKAVPLFGWEPGPAGNVAGSVVFFILASVLAPLCTVAPLVLVHALVRAIAAKS